MRVLSAARIRVIEREPERLRGELIAGVGGVSGLDDAPHAPRPHTQNVEAWKAYLRGVFHTNRPDISDDASAINHFQRVVSLDPLRNHPRYRDLVSVPQTE